MDKHWRDRAACAGEHFLMEAPAFEAEAKALCAKCPVIEDCRAEMDRIEKSWYDLPDSVVAGENRTERIGRRTKQKRSRPVEDPDAKLGWLLLATPTIRKGSEPVYAGKRCHRCRKMMRARSNPDHPERPIHYCRGFCSKCYYPVQRAAGRLAAA